MSQLLPLATPIGARYDSLTVDSRLTNCVAEQNIDQQGFSVYKRPGFQLRLPIAPGVGRGVFYWRNGLYCVIDGNLYRCITSTIPSFTLIGAVNASGRYYFTSCLGATPLVFLTNGNHAYTVDIAGTLTDVTAAITGQSGFAGAPWVPSVINIDGYITLADTTSNIWTSGLNTPGSWPGNYGIAQIEPDYTVALFKQISYLLCIKQFYTEAFYDAGQTPWPYGRVDGAKMNYGCVDPRTVCDVGGEVMWVSQTREGEVDVILVSSLKASPVGTPSVIRLLSAADYTGNVYSWAAKFMGHRLYGVTITNANLTLVYDLTSKVWYQWTDANGDYLPYVAATVGTTNEVIFQGETDGNLYVVSVHAFADDGVVFPVDIYTPNFDGGTRKVKELAKLSIFGDQANGSTVDLFTSDDDYQTWTAAGSADLSTDDPFWADLGSFKKRAFHFHHQANTPFRVEKVEPLLKAGSL